MNNAKELNTMPVNFPVELINDLLCQYHSLKITLIISQNEDKNVSVENHCHTIRKVLAVLNINPDEQ